MLKAAADASTNSGTEQSSATAGDPTHRDPAIDREGPLLTTAALVWRYSSKTVLKRADQPLLRSMPRVLKTLQGPQEGSVWIFTEYVEGEPLESAWESCSAAQREAIISNSRASWTSFAKPAGDFIGGVEKTACYDQIFLNSGRPYESTSGGFGPFEDEEAFRSGIAEALRHCDSHAAFTDMIISLVHAMPKQDASGDEAPLSLPTVIWSLAIFWCAMARWLPFWTGR
ncbi:hypothetical protein MAPG_11171 [Magnaporthiopsis poae ATCC 64411]|uniref:Uncharacterized protein n=1 Tax=Magnaporthiopsis poae (strain ATCC 64411 / 73-15) TaxID=644358 RepID=A0A0C4EEJ8_MAGP6|nr:hypothetical protein MAPG_11171 [Magnaporthiopsis poae ATCC 64411]